MKIGWKIPAAVAAIAAAGTYSTLRGWTRTDVSDTWRRLASSAMQAAEGPPGKPWLRERKSASPTTWDGRTVELTPTQAKAIGLVTLPVAPQVEPIILKLAGATDYDPATLTIVRSPFDSRVDKVLVDQGSLVKQGDPLVELFSAELAQTKSDYDVARTQWDHDKKVLDLRAPLIEKETLPRKELIEIQNNEIQSRTRMKLAKDKLLVYGLTDKEIEESLTEVGLKKATLTLRSRADGTVIRRSVVKGNYYDQKDELMTIAPLDHLWVRGNVSEIDADAVEVGQNLRVIFPYSHRTVDAKVVYIDKAIDPVTRAAKFRASIPNPEGRLKSGSFVRVLLEVPPVAGRTVIPRIAMVAVDQLDFVFVKKPGPAFVFERRKILTTREGNDQVVVSEPSKDHPGLKPGELVATSGSLILEQMFEDKMMTGAPARSSLSIETDPPAAVYDTTVE
jgi:cobalt-zinc-cadmium efflux system membrane fusion protein